MRYLLLCISYTRYEIKKLERPELLQAWVINQQEKYLEYEESSKKN